MKLYIVTAEFETIREAQIIETSMYLAADTPSARKAAMDHIRDNYFVADWPEIKMTSREFTGTFAPVRLGVLKESGWREVETNREIMMA